jgi:hypothetical protein
LPHPTTPPKQNIQLLLIIIILYFKLKKSFFLGKVFTRCKFLERKRKGWIPTFVGMTYVGMGMTYVGMGMTYGEVGMTEV